MDPTPLVVVAVIAILGVAIFSIVNQGQKRKALWEMLAGQLGLEHRGSVLLGEYQGVPVRIAVETRRNPHGYDQLCVVRADIPGALPEGFVAAPRRWTSGLDRMLADNTFQASDPALQECYVFQSDQPQQGQALIYEPEAQKALLELYSPKRVGFVEKNRVHVAYTGLVEDAEELRAALLDVTQTAHTLARAQARLAQGA
ncbi:hypothetical protein [Hyalangium minutum]|uniref:Uncharacterized protein n=1 Tax=Hyalangium minutum TaxID=394096 RepID=A0A085WK33_9BACT|nr:hypothetical protein [Hyalangium minutum]KFE68046.1 hypothetical protein DB31_7283 [Hyalangium minutum]